MLELEMIEIRSLPFTPLSLILAIRSAYLTMDHIGR
jgi:hypothetical protein